MYLSKLSKEMHSFPEVSTLLPGKHRKCSCWLVKWYLNGENLLFHVVTVIPLTNLRNKITGYEMKKNKGGLSFNVYKWIRTPETRSHNSIQCSYIFIKVMGTEFCVSKCRLLLITNENYKHYKYWWGGRIMSTEKELNLQQIGKSGNKGCDTGRDYKNLGTVNACGTYNR